MRGSELVRIYGPGVFELPLSEAQSIVARRYGRILSPDEDPGPDLPSIEELTIEPPGPDRSPAELSAIMRHSMGLADAPPRQPDTDRPDVSAIRQELGL
jgi:hypothetical protein